jgi:hypothetical protein
MNRIVRSPLYFWFALIWARKRWSVTVNLPPEIRTRAPFELC